MSGTSINIIDIDAGGFKAGLLYPGAVNWEWCGHEPHGTRREALACAEMRLHVHLNPPLHTPDLRPEPGRDPYSRGARLDVLGVPYSSPRHAKPPGSLRSDQVAGRRALPASRLNTMTTERDDHVL